MVGVERVLEQMVQMRLQPTIVTMNSVPNAYAQSKGVIGVERVPEQISQMGLQPDTVAKNSVLNAYAESTDVVGAERVLEQMGHMGFQPDTNTLNSVLKAHVAPNRVHTSAAVVKSKQIDEFALQPDLHTCLRLLLARKKTRDSKRTYAWFDESLQAGIDPIKTNGKIDPLLCNVPLQTIGERSVDQYCATRE